MIRRTPPGERGRNRVGEMPKLSKVDINKYYLEPGMSQSPSRKRLMGLKHNSS
jgi:hypothetical protein